MNKQTTPIVGFAVSILTAALLTGCGGSDKPVVTDPPGMSGMSGINGAPTANGEAVYKDACFVCHDMAVAGAPKLGDVAAWAPRIATGKQAMLQSALNGKGAKPPKGGRGDLSDAEVSAALDYMVGKVQ